MTSNRLTVLAADIRTAHLALQADARSIAERALEIGQWLNEAKAALPHGQWGPWLAGQVGISPRTARRYMRLAQSGLKTDTVADLGIVGALKEIGRERRSLRLRPPRPEELYVWHGPVPPQLGGPFQAVFRDDLYHPPFVFSFCRLLNEAVFEWSPRPMKWGSHFSELARQQGFDRFFIEDSGYSDLVRLREVEGHADLTNVRAWLRDLVAVP